MVVENKEILAVLDAVERFLTITLPGEQLGPDAEMGAEDILFKVLDLIKKLKAESTASSSKQPPPRAPKGAGSPVSVKRDVAPPRPPKDNAPAVRKEPPKFVEEETYDDICEDDKKKIKQNQLNKDGRPPSSYMDMTLGQQQENTTDLPPPPESTEVKNTVTDEPENYEVPETEKQPDVQENYEVPSEEQSFVQEDYEVPSEELPQCEDEAGEEEITEEQLKWKLIQLGKNGPAEIKRTCVCSGHLFKHKKKMFSTKWHKRFCVVKDNFLFYFKSETENKEKGVIILPGYDVCIDKQNSNGKTFIFKLNPLVKGRSPYQFQVETHEELEMWQQALHPICKRKLLKSDTDSLERVAREFSEQNGGSNETSAGEAIQPIQPIAATEEMYEFIDEQTGLKGGLPPPGDIVQEETYDDVSESTIPRPPIEPMTVEEEEYDDVGNVTPPKVAVEPIQEDIYESIDIADIAPIRESREPPKQLHLNTVQAPSLPPPRSPMLSQRPGNDFQPPPPPLPMRNPSATNSVKGTQEVLEEEEDEEIMPAPPEPERVPAENDFSYDNVYLGLYNCEAEENNELSFHRGDVIYVLDKVDVHWWIGFLNGKVGLVPCSYLTEGFEH